VKAKIYMQDYKKKKKKKKEVLALFTCLINKLQSAMTAEVCISDIYNK